MKFALIFLGGCLAIQATASVREGFTLISPADSGIRFTNLLAEQRHLTNQILLNGSGVAAGDVDGDGLCDLYFARLDGPNALYRNLGNWHFEEIAAAAGVALPDHMSTGCALADLDGDGDLDLVVNSLGQGTQIYLNDGNGKFRSYEKTLNLGKGGMSIAVGDLDGDGWLDLYIANYRTLGLMDIPNATANFRRLANGRVVVESLNGRPTTAPDLTNRFSVNARGGMEENGEADVIYRNLGGTNFAPLSWTSGNFFDEDGNALTSELYDWGLTVMIRDFTGDGLPDIYVCNDFQTPDRVWINQGNGKFRLAKREAFRKSSMFSMAADFADIDRDGADDLFVVDMLSRSHAQRMREMLDPPIESMSRPQSSMNTLFLNRGDSTFAEVARYAGLQASEWSWSCIFLDVDLDGYEDLLISNGMERAARDLDMSAKMKALRAEKKRSDAEIFEARKEFPKLATANLAFRNTGALSFEDRSAAWGFNLPGVSQGMALADLDNDGDLDVAINNLNAPAAIYQNDSDAPRLAVRLKGSGRNTHGIGARITVRSESLPPQSQTIIAGGRYLSSDDAVRVFARSPGTTARVEIVWPDGKRSEATSADAVRETFEEPANASAPAAHPTQATPLFEDVSTKLAFNHTEAEFDDFARQPLLPKRLSRAGPGVAWYDFDGDGWEDLVIGNGRGGRIAAFRNDRKGGFEPVEAPVLKRALPRDTGAVLGWRGSPGHGFVLASFSNYEDGQPVGSAVSQFDLLGPSSGDIVAASESSAGAIALADVDGDGQLDLFLGGTCLPGKYPAAANSRLLRNENRRLVATTNQPALAMLGLVQGAVFSDLDGDKDQDLVVTTDWGSVRVLMNEAGVFNDRTEQLGLAKYDGWWTGVAVGDFDEDGRMDIVAGNWGLNTFPKPLPNRPLKIFHGDFDQDGTYDVIESYFDPELNADVPARQLSVLAKSLNTVRQAFHSNAEYCTASVEKVLGASLGEAKVLRANWLASTVFLNRGDHFEAKALPKETQFAPAFGVAVADFDGDGHQDIALAQNFFDSQPEIPRQDAGRGLILLGNGRGEFSPMPGQNSGIEIYGQQRGLAAGDFDRDGRADLIFGQNGGPARLYHNVAAKPALRVSFEGSSANPDAIGATIRFVTSGKARARQEVQSSAGWLSQNSHVLLVGAPEKGELQVRWPDGLEESLEIPAGVKQVRLRREREKK